MGIMKENLVLKRLGKTYFPDHFSAGSWTYGHYIEMELLKTNLN